MEEEDNMGRLEEAISDEEIICLLLEERDSFSLFEEIWLDAELKDDLGMLEEYDEAIIFDEERLILLDVLAVWDILESNWLLGEELTKKEDEKVTLLVEEMIVDDNLLDELVTWDILDDNRLEEASLDEEGKFWLDESMNWLEEINSDDDRALFVLDELDSSFLLELDCLENDDGLEEDEELEEDGSLYNKTIVVTSVIGSWKSIVALTRSPVLPSNVTSMDIFSRESPNHYYDKFCFAKS